MKEKSKITTFRDPDAWREGHKLVAGIYKITKSFPRDEVYGITSQMRRAAVSITANIAESFGRRAISDKSHFYVMAQGSLTELQNLLDVARDVQYLKEEIHAKFDSQTVVVHKLMTGLIKSNNARKA